MTLVYRTGFAFGFDPSACLECPGYCCCGGSGLIWVSPGEIREISFFLREAEVDFINRYLIFIDNRFSLKEYHTECGFACIFFDLNKKRCRIYSVRPSQCLRYPFWQAFRGKSELVLKECPGVRCKL